MPRGSHILGHAVDEAKWERAKERASEEGHAGEYDYIMGIYKRMTRSGEYEPKFTTERHKKKWKMDRWREKHKDWKGEVRRMHSKEYAAASKSIDGVGGVEYTGATRLVVSKGRHSMDEFRCPSCGALLLKGKNLEKALIEVKCRRCGSLIVNGT